LPKVMSAGSTTTDAFATAQLFPAIDVADVSAAGIVTLGPVVSIIVAAAARAAASLAFWACVRASQMTPTSMESEAAAMRATSAKSTVSKLVPRSSRRPFSTVFGSSCVPMSWRLASIGTPATARHRSR
jgi:hypothetical protein